MFNWILGVIAVLALLILGAGYGKAKKNGEKNELFNWQSIVIATFYCNDFISDVFFCGKLLIHSDDVYFLVLFIFSLVFILLPIVFNVYQLHSEISKWNTDVANSNGNMSTKQVSRWIESRIKFVYVLSFITRSTFSSIALLNSYLFQLEIFGMGLSKRQKASFQNKQIFSVVLLEVKFLYVTVLI